MLGRIFKNLFGPNKRQMSDEFINILTQLMRGQMTDDPLYNVGFMRGCVGVYSQLCPIKFSMVELNQIGVEALVRTVGHDNAQSYLFRVQELLDSHPDAGVTALTLSTWGTGQQIAIDRSIAIFEHSLQH
jgi:hypothetical protein